MSNPYLDYVNALNQAMFGRPRYLAQAIGPAGAEYVVGEYPTIAAANAALDQLSMGQVVTQVIDLDDPERGNVAGEDA